MNIENMQDWMWAVIVMPIVIGFFKNEIGTIFTAMVVYLRREFSPGDTVRMHNPATGGWGDVLIVDYKFRFSSATRGVYVRHDDGGVERIPLVTWGQMRKRPIPKSIENQSGSRIDADKFEALR